MSWSWSCHFGFGLGLVRSGLGLGHGLGLKNLVLFTSLAEGGGRHIVAPKYSVTIRSRPACISTALTRRFVNVGATTLLQSALYFRQLSSYVCAKFRQRLFPIWGEPQNADAEKT